MGGRPVVTLDDGRSLADRLRTLQSTEVDAWLAVGGFDDAHQPAGARGGGTRRRRAATRGPARSCGPARACSTTTSSACSSTMPRRVVANPRPDAAARSWVRCASTSQRSCSATRDRGGVLAPGSRDPGPRGVGAIGGLRSDERAGRRRRGSLGAIRVLADAGRRDGRSGQCVGWPGGCRDAGRRGAAGSLGSPPTRATRPRVADLLQTHACAPRHAARAARGARGDAGRRARRARHLLEDLPAGFRWTCSSAAARRSRGAPRPAQMARMLLDGVRPVGVTQLAVDSA